MEGFIALAVFAEQMSNQQEKLPSTHHRRGSNRDDEPLQATENLAASYRQVQVEKGKQMAAE